MGVEQALPARLGMFIQIVILYLAEIPVVGIHDLAERIGITVVRETHLADGSAFLLFLQPLRHAHGLQLFPGGHIIEHMHEIIIHIVRPQAAQFLLESFLDAVHALDHIVGQFGGDIDLLADAVFLKDLTDGRLAAGVDISRIKVVHTAPVCLHDLPLRLFQVDLASGLLKTHTAKAQN